MFTTPAKVIALVLGVIALGGLTINQLDLSRKVDDLSTMRVAITPTIIPTSIPTATPSATVKYAPTIRVIQPTSHVVK